jgi:hypothetical protein
MQPKVANRMTAEAAGSTEVVWDLLVRFGRVAEVVEI